MRKYIELTEYDTNGRTVIFVDCIQGLCRVRDGEYNKEFTEVMVSGYTFIVNEPIDEILESIKALEQSSYISIKTELNGDTVSRQAVLNKILKFSVTDGRSVSVSGLWTEINDLPPVMPQEPCEDAISREMALKECHDIVVDGERYRVIQEETLLGLPPVNPQPKTGHWKRISIDKYSEHAKYWYECDKCGKHNLGNTNFCPNCGAKMVEPQKSEE